MNILLTGAGGSATTLWEQYSPYTVYYVDADPLRIAPCIEPERRARVPLAGDPDYIETVIDLCFRWRIDLVVPSVDEEVPVCVGLERYHGIDVLMPEQMWAIGMLDKFNAMRTLRRQGIPVPDTWIDKPRWGRGSRGLMIRQQELFGQEYTVQMMADRMQRLHAIVPVVVLDKRGITMRGMTEANEAVSAACQRIHEAAPARGTYNIQGKLCPDGVFRPFEINPRVSTTTGLAMAAGCDPVTIWGAGPPNGLRPFTAGRTLARYWENVIT